ncbi:TetR/AcrR family transcriptional regulator [Mycobacterium sp.]|uniref:TetR/AcrR family transcriptional regulator n=1 Tax=Mycobacterium sp. TaxID=1785 RepID=UPI0025F1CF9D|nr:TetR/AcrR family transcriptional regulator [Mycobacterium sp.]
MDVKVDSTPADRAADRRVRRSRAALMRAAVEVVIERDTANITVSEIADAADVSRPLLYQHFHDRDTLLLEAALDLAERELMPQITREPRLEVVVEHFAQHRRFYRAILKSSRSYDLTHALNTMLGPFNQSLIDLVSRDRLEPHGVEDLTLFIAGGLSTVINTWLIETPDPLDVPAFTQRLLKILPRLADIGAVELP